MPLCPTAVQKYTGLTTSNRNFLGQSSHPFAAAAEEPFLTTVAKSRFSLGFVALVWVARIGTVGGKSGRGQDNFSDSGAIARA